MRRRLLPHRSHAKVVATTAVVVAALFLGDGPASAAARSIDDRFVAVASEVPAFGGMFVAGKELKVYLTERRRRAWVDAGRAIREAFPGQGLPRRLDVLSARFGFTRLKAWHDRLSAAVLRLSGVVLTDIDDRKNRLTVGVENRETRDWVARRLPTLRIPRDAVRIELMAPIMPQTGRGLRAHHRPLVGGLQIRYEDWYLNTFPNCTIGFIAIRGGESGFVTASHCSTILSSSDIACDPAVVTGCVFPSDGTGTSSPSGHTASA